MKLNSKKQVFIMHENKRIQAHHDDGSILHWKNHSIIYISPKGIKNTLSLDQIYRSQDLTNKFKQCLKMYNVYSNEHNYIYFVNNKNKEELEFEPIKMSMKIDQFRWQNPQIQEHKDGYIIASDCKLAKLKLMTDLYLIEVIYHQYIGGKNTYLSRTPNMTKYLLQKYNYQYAEFPIHPTQKQYPEYHYIKHTKIFSIFNVPNQWKYPLHLIWTALINYTIIPHQFCYFEYQGKEMAIKTPMPSFINVFDLLNNEENNGIKDEEELFNIPILGRINHLDKCIFMKVEDCCSWFTSVMNLLYDGIGFWFYSNNVISYRNKNKVEIDEEFYPRAIPYVIRFKNQPERTLLDELKLYMSYCEQNQKLATTKQLKKQYNTNTTRFDNENNLICEVVQPDLGNFKAYSNGMIIIKFIDRCMLTINSKKMQAKMINQSGQTSFIDISNPDSLSYKKNRDYIVPTLNFQQRVFYPDEWIHKQQIKQQIQNAIQISNTLQKTSQTYLKL